MSSGGLDAEAVKLIAEAEARTGTALGVARKAVARLEDAEHTLRVTAAWADEQRKSRPGDPALDQLTALLAPWR